jgi:outer membrane lipoprotein carrier protein
LASKPVPKRAATSKFSLPARAFGAFTFILAGLALAANPAVAEGESLGGDEVVAGLQDWLDGTRELEGRFEQQLVSGALGSGLAESGRLYISRPGRMRWDYLDPERKVALVDGGRTWLYLEEDEQLILGRLADQGELLPRLLTGGEPIGSSFDAEVLAAPRRPRKGIYQIKLVPRGGHEAFEHVVLALQAPRFAIEAAEVLDAAGNRVYYRFFDLRRNGGLDEELFRFEPPDGTSVLGEH